MPSKEFTDILNRMDAGQEIDPYEKIIVAEVLNEVINRARGILISEIYKLNDACMKENIPDEDKNTIEKLRAAKSVYHDMQPTDPETVRENIFKIDELKERMADRERFVMEALQ